MLIENFEKEHYSLKKATPVDSVIELMEANGLKQKDLIDVFGTPSIVSEVLKGKRNLTTEHIRRLSARFSVTPALFIRDGFPHDSVLPLHRLSIPTPHPIPAH